MADHPSPCDKHRDIGDCELELMAEQFDVVVVAVREGRARHRDDSIGRHRR